MQAFLVLMRASWKVVLAIVLAVPAVLIVLTFAWPWLLAAFESLTGTRLTPEQYVRLATACVFVLLAAASALASILTQNAWFRRAALILLGSVLLFTPMYLWDPTHLKDEASWIRYPTAFFLALASLGALLLSRRYNQGTRWPSGVEWAWYLLAFGFLFAGFDEIFTIHEIAGGLLERVFGFAHITTDFITVGYSVVGLLVLLVTVRLFRPIVGSMPSVLLRMLLAGLTFFVIAQAFDTADVLMTRSLTWLVRNVYDGGRIVLPSLFDFWYTPQLLVNSIEEVFEYLAAVLFFIGTVSVLWPTQQERCATTPGQRRMAVLAGVALVLALVLPSFFRSDFLRANSPFADGTAATARGGHNEGLFHADDLAYDAAVGLIIGNESRTDFKGTPNGPGVLLSRSGAITRLPDPENVLLDTDSVAIVDGRVYASASGFSSIFRFDDAQQKFVLVAGRTQGLYVPEGFDAHNGTLYVLDEHERVIDIVAPDGTVTAEKPEHDLWKGPESIRFVPQIAAFLITDDKSGVIFRYVPGEPIALWADRSLGLRNPEGIALAPDGTILVTDNGLGEILTLDEHAKILSRKKLRWLYRDGQGIVAEPNGMVDFITADGFEGLSFMPSVLWQYQ